MGRISVYFICRLAVSLPLQTYSASPLRSSTAISLAPLGTHPTTGIQHSIANTAVFLDLFKHATPFTRNSPEIEYFSNAGVFSPYGGSLAPKFAADQYPTSLYADTKCRMTVKATIGNGGALLPPGQYVCLYDGEGTLKFEGDATLLSFSAATKR